MEQNAVTLLILLLVGVAGVLGWIAYSQNGRVTDLTGQVAVLQKQIGHKAQQQFDDWKNKELQQITLRQKEIASREAQVQLQEWKIAHETSIRQDAIFRSQSVITGKVSEHLAPYFPGFPYNPKDARFIGSPIDIIVFDGANDGEVQEVVFLEVKTGSSSLNCGACGMARVKPLTPDYNLNLTHL
jgi:predicted Holliday junction resolvase-like endonuclease